MYLTEELFHSADHDHSSAMAWKATSPDSHSSTESLGKRKRGTDNGGEYTVCAMYVLSTKYVGEEQRTTN